jgi:hypothetical protein
MLRIAADAGAHHSYFVAVKKLFIAALIFELVSPKGIMPSISILVA